MFKVPSQQFMRHIDSISKDTLQLKILPTWINVRANSFTKTWVNIIKRKLMKVPGKKYQLHKSLSLEFEKHCTKIDHISLIFSFHLFLKFNIVLIDILDNFHHPEVYTVPLCFFIRTSKIWWGSLFFFFFFWRSPTSNVFYCAFIFKENLLLVNSENYSWLVLTRRARDGWFLVC